MEIIFRNENKTLKENLGFDAGERIFQKFITFFLITYNGKILHVNPPKISLK